MTLKTLYSPITEFRSHPSSGHTYQGYFFTLSSTDQWPGRKTESNTHQHDEDVLPQEHEGLGSLFYSSSWSMKQHQTRDHGCVTLPYVNWKKEKDAISKFPP